MQQSHPPSASGLLQPNPPLLVSPLLCMLPAGVQTLAQQCKAAHAAVTTALCFWPVATQPTLPCLSTALLVACRCADPSTAGQYSGCSCDDCPMPGRHDPCSLIPAGIPHILTEAAMVCCRCADVSTAGQCSGCSSHNRPVLLACCDPTLPSLSLHCFAWCLQVCRL